MRERWKQWHDLIGWLMSVGMTPEDVTRAVVAYQKKQAEDSQLEFQFKTG
jgi:hypothetical protein